MDFSCEKFLKVFFCLEKKIFICMKKRRNEEFLCEKYLIFMLC